MLAFLGPGMSMSRGRPTSFVVRCIERGDTGDGSANRYLQNREEAHPTVGDVERMQRCRQFNQLNFSFKVELSWFGSTKSWLN